MVGILVERYNRAKVKEIHGLEFSKPLLLDSIPSAIYYPASLKAKVSEELRREWIHNLIVENGFTIWPLTGIHEAAEKLIAFWTTWEEGCHAGR